MKTLVIGANGFIGAHLTRYLSDMGCDSVGIIRVGGIKNRKIRVNKAHIELDINNRQALSQFILQYKPEKIFHLAAQSNPRKSWNDPLHTFQENTCNPINFFEVLREIKYEGCVIIAGSSAEYAINTQPNLIDEKFPTTPVSPYGISKLAQDHLARLYFERYGLNIIRVRPFYLIGRGKNGDVCSDFARGIAMIESGNSKVLKVGELSIVRDFLDVRDGVDAMVKIAMSGIYGDVYNICSSKGYSLKNILQKFINLSDIEVKVRLDKCKLRKIDELVKIGDSKKLRQLGWKPRYDIDTSLAEILDFWRKKA